MISFKTENKTSFKINKRIGPSISYVLKRIKDHASLSYRVFLQFPLKSIDQQAYSVINDMFGWMDATIVDIVADQAFKIKSTKWSYPMKGFDLIPKTLYEDSEASFSFNTRATKLTRLRNGKG